MQNVIKISLDISQNFVMEMELKYRLGKAMHKTAHICKISIKGII